jgi:malonyl-CoA decarboxylase
VASAAPSSRRRRSWIERLGLVAERGRHVLNLPLRREQDAAELSRRLLTQPGEASALALARELVTLLERLDAVQTVDFLELLAADFSPPADEVESAVDGWRQRRDVEALLALGEAVEAPRQELFRRLNMTPGGTATIVRLRGRLLELLPQRPHLKGVEADLRHLLVSWFNRGFLQIEQIDWHTPAAVLEKLITYESVHEIKGWEDLRRRLAADRRCFAFFHPALPEEPLIFVEVALTRGLAGEVLPLIDPAREVMEVADANTAIFYSINNCHVGLRGISFGNFLIKQVVTELSSELPGLDTFATLSPLPRLRGSLEDRGRADGFTEARLRALIGDQAADLSRRAGVQESVPALFDVLARPGAQTAADHRVLTRLALAYLLELRRGLHVLDPVAHFHLANGASVERVNPAGDLSAHGWRQSYGVMVNYRYDPDRLELNHERYVATGEVATGRGLAAEAARVRAAWRAAG